MRERIERLSVVVPVRDEEQLLAATLGRITAAMDQVESSGRRTARLVVVLDACTDGSARVAGTVAAADPRIRIVTTDAGCVGAARALGVATAMAGFPRSPLHRQWIANTDADTLVPGDWLQKFADEADAGADALLGTVEPDERDLGPHRHAAWQAAHVRQDGHPHIHGANLGVRASAYALVGGFPPVPRDEDVRLVQALRTSGAVVRASGRLHVVTSGRLQGRAPRGFADYLSRLPDDGRLRAPAPGTTKELDRAEGRT